VQGKYVIVELDGLQQQQQQQQQQQGLCNGRASVRPSVCLSHHSFAARRYDGFLLCARPAENIGRLRHGRRPAASAPQHGTQQQTRAVSRLQLTQEAEHGLTEKSFIWLN